MCAWLGFERGSNFANRPPFPSGSSSLCLHASRHPHKKRKEERERGRERRYYNPFWHEHFDEPFGLPAGFGCFIVDERYTYRMATSLDGRETVSSFFFPFSFFPPPFLPFKRDADDHTGGSTVWLSLMSSNGRLFCWTKSWKIL